MKIIFQGVNIYGDFMFVSDNNVRFNVFSLDSGIVTMKITCASSFEEVAKMVVSFFTPGSSCHGIKAVQLNFRGKYFYITAKNANLEELLVKYKSYSKPKPIYF